MIYWFLSFGKAEMDDGLDWIREGLKRPGKTQSGLAKAFGRAPSAITALLKNGRQLKAHEIATAARYRSR